MPQRFPSNPSHFIRFSALTRIHDAVFTAADDVKLIAMKLDKGFDKGQRFLFIKVWQMNMNGLHLVSISISNVSFSETKQNIIDTFGTQFAILNKDKFFCKKLYFTDTTGGDCPHHMYDTLLAPQRGDRLMQNIENNLS